MSGMCFAHVGSRLSSFRDRIIHVFSASFEERPQALLSCIAAVSSDRAELLCVSAPDSPDRQASSAEEERPRPQSRTRVPKKVPRLSQFHLQRLFGCRSKEGQPRPPATLQASIPPPRTSTPDAAGIATTRKPVVVAIAVGFATTTTAVMPRAVMGREAPPRTSRIFVFGPLEALGEFSWANRLYRFPRRPTCLFLDTYFKERKSPFF